MHHRIIPDGPITRSSRLAVRNAISRRGLLMLKCSVLVCAAFIVTPFNQGIAAEKFQLSLNLEKGKTYPLKVTYSQKITRTIEGSKQNLDQTTGIGYSCKVTEISSDGDATLNVIFDYVYLSQTSATMNVVFDSSNPPPDLPFEAKPFAALVGQSFTITISRTGEIKSLRGASKLVKQMLNELDLAKDPMGGSRATMLKEGFGEQAMTEKFAKLFNFYPSDPVEAGDTWTTTTALMVDTPPMIMKNTWTLVKRDAGLATIKNNSNIGPNPDGKPRTVGETGMSYEISGLQNGTLEIFESTGWPRLAKYNQHVSGVVHLEGGKQSPDQASWPITIESTIVVESAER